MREHYLLILLLSAIAFTSVGGAVALSVNELPERLEYAQEWVRVLLQIGFVAVLGIVTSLVLERFKDTLQRRRDMSKLRFDVLTELSRTYMDVKLVRRKLQQSNSFTAADVDELNQLQVVIELHKRVSVFLFHQHSQLAGHLKMMEKYLNRVANSQKSSERSDFLSKGFREFSNAYSDAVTLIQGEIVRC